MLKKQFRKHGYVFTLIGIGRRHLLYQQKDSVSIAYEIHKIRFRPGTIICGKVIRPCLHLPSDEEFGTFAWSFADYDRALARITKLEGHEVIWLLENLTNKDRPDCAHGPGPVVFFDHQCVEDQ